MSRTYKATGINLKSMPMGESDRLLTILTREHGLIRAIALGSRKHNSRMGGRSELFVVNELLIAKGRSLDKVTQAETVESYPGLGQDLKKLIASQYLAELCLCQALSDQPQEDLFCLLNEHLERLERSAAADVLAHLTHAVFQLLILAGIAPQVYSCCVTRQPLTPDFADPHWRIGFSIAAGGTVTLAALERLMNKPPRPSETPTAASTPANQSKAAEATSAYRGAKPPAHLNIKLTATELALLQQLAEAELPHLNFNENDQIGRSSRLAAASTAVVPHSSVLSVSSSVEAEKVWHTVERVLRHYAQYHFDRPIRSAALIDACFVADPALF